MAKEELYIEAKLDAEQLYQDLKELKSQIEKQKMDVKVDVKLTKNSQQVIAQVNQMTEANKKAAKAAEENAWATGKLDKAVTQWQEAFKSMSPAIQEQIDKVLELEKRYKALQEAARNPVTATQQVQEALRATNIELSDARKELNKMTAPLKEATKQTNWFFGSLKWIASRSLTTWLLSTFWAFSLAWAIAKTLKTLIATVNESIQTFISFESAFAWVRKTVEATEFQFDAFNQTLKQMTTYIPMAYEDLAKIAELGWQMGVPIENLAKFTETLAAISVSTNLWLESAALSLSRIASVLWIDYNDVDRLGSAIVDLWNNFAATESEITTFMEKIAWTGNVVWFTAWDIAWISAAITSVWIASEKWGTAVNKFAITINDAVTKGWDKLKTLAKLAGKTTEEFQDLWNTNAWEAFTEVVEWLWAAWDNAVTYIEKLVWTWTRMKEVFLNMASASDKLREAIERGNNAYYENQALMEEAAKRYGTTESKIEMLNNQVKLNRELLWEELIPLYMKLKQALVELSNRLTQVVKWFNSLSEVAQNWVLYWGIAAIATIIATVLNPALWILLWALWTLGVYLAQTYNPTEDEAYALWELHDAMEDVNSQIYKVEEDIKKLNEDFEKWYISIDKYNDSLKELRKQQIELKNSQKELTEQLVAFENVNEKTEDMKKWFEDRVTALAKYDEQILETRNKIDWLKKEHQALSEALNNWSISQEEFEKKTKALNEEIDKQTANFNNLKEQQGKWEKSLKDYWAAIEKVYPWLQALNEYTSNQVELENLLNDMVINTDASQASVDALRQRFDELRAAAIAAIEAMITEKELELDEKIRYNKNWKATWWSTHLYWIKKYNEEVDKLDKMRDKVVALYEMDFDTVFWGIQKEKKLTTEQLLWIDPNDWSIEQLRQRIYDVQKDREKYNETSEEFIKLWELETKLKDRLNNALKEESDNLDDTIDKAAKAGKSEEDLLKIQEERLRVEAQKKVLALDKELLWEEAYANAVIKINEDLEKAKDNLRKDWYDKEVDAMNEIIEKYKELRKEAEDAMSWLAGDIKDVSSDIGKLIKKIQDLRAKLKELEEKRVTDLWNRYVKLQKDLEEIDKQISELTAKTSERGTTWETVTEAWESIQDAIDEAIDNVEDYQKEIDKLMEKMKDLESDTTDKLSDRYAAVVEEVQKLNKELEVYTKYDILTDADAKAKATLEEQIASLLSEKNKIEENLTDAQLERAENMVGETETDKILRQAAEQKAAYQQEIDEYKAKMAEQNSILEQYRAQESEILEKYNFLDTKSSQAKYDEMIKQLEDYKDERDAILKEMDMISQNLTAQQIQEAILNSKKTETELILENYYTQKQALEAELDDYENQLNKKLKLLAQYYGDAALLQQKYGDLWIKFSDEDLEKIREAAYNMEWLNKTSAYANYNWDIFKEQREAVEKQKEAQKSLDTISKNLEKITDYQLKQLWTDNLKAIYAKILELQLTASGKGIGTGNVTTTSNINQNFNVNNINDAALIAAAIRRQIKL